MIKKLPLLYFPSTICWVDDNELFLDAVNGLFSKDYNCRVFVNPKDAIDFLSSYSSPFSKITFMREFTENDLFNTQDHVPVDINISELVSLASAPTRANELSLLVIDNNMPHMTGLDMCDRIKGSSYKKILLTGQAGLHEVVEAFNDGIIDRFLAKSHDVVERLKDSIRALSLQYFYDRTKNLLALIEVVRPSPMSDPVFIDFFYQWVERNNYSEFYLIDKNGSYFLKDKNGGKAYFIVMSEHVKNEFLRLNDEEFDNSTDLYLKVLRGEMIPFFGLGNEAWQFSCKDWGRFFYPANIIEGRDRYYWTSIKLMEE